MYPYFSTRSEPTTFAPHTLMVRLNACTPVAAIRSLLFTPRRLAALLTRPCRYTGFFVSFPFVASRTKPPS